MSSIPAGLSPNSSPRFVRITLRTPGSIERALQILMLFLSAFRYVRLVRIRSRQAIRQGGGALALVVMLLRRSPVVAAELPYRLVWKNNFERIDVGEARCYAIGEATASCWHFALMSDPLGTGSWTETTRALQRSGIVESIFTPLEESR